MRYQVRETKAGKFQAVLINPSFGYERISIFDTKADAVEFLNSKKMESDSALSHIPTVSEYFGKVSN